MTVVLQRPIYADKLVAPTSKSAAHRALIAAAFADTRTELVLRTSCEDIEATVRCLTALGATVEKTDTGLTVTPVKRNEIIKNAVLDCGESGSTLRFLLPVCAALGADASFLRRGRLPKRPLSPLKEELEAHGLSVWEEGDVLKTGGVIANGDYRIAADVSSQYITGLLFALSLLDAPSTLTLTGTVESAPYIDMTVDVLTCFGVAPRKKNNRFSITGAKKAPFLSEKACPRGGLFRCGIPLGAWCHWAARRDGNGAIAPLPSRG